MCSQYFKLLYPLILGLNLEMGILYRVQRRFVESEVSSDMKDMKRDHEGEESKVSTNPEFSSIPRWP